MKHLYNTDQGTEEMRRHVGFTVSYITFLIIASIGIWGWIWNIVKIINIGLNPITGMIILRVIGIPLAPLGVVLGYL